MPTQTSLCAHLIFTRPPTQSSPTLNPDLELEVLAPIRSIHHQTPMCISFWTDLIASHAHVMAWHAQFFSVYRTAVHWQLI